MKVIKFSCPVNFDYIERIMSRCGCSCYSWLDIDSMQPILEIYADDHSIQKFMNEVSKIRITPIIMKEGK